jgi:RimJ/RimL family protein N-acetyltransferase
MAGLHSLSVFEERCGGWIEYRKKIPERGRTRESYHFAIELRSGKKVIGGVSIQRIDRFQGASVGGPWINARYQN